MLIEVRSSATDPNNTPTQLFQRFKETLILKPRTRIALVSALITTEKTDGYVINADNDTLELSLGSYTNFNITLTHGNYTGDSLATEIQTKIRTGVSASTNAFFKSSFYPDSQLICDYDGLSGFHILLIYQPQGYGITPDTGGYTNALNDKGAILSNVSADIVGNVNLLTRSRMNRNGIVELVAGSLEFRNSIFPYQTATTNQGHSDYKGYFDVDRIVSTTIPQKIGISNGITGQLGRYLLPEGNPWTPLLGARAIYVDNYVPSPDSATGVIVDYGYDWIFTLVNGAVISTSYAKLLAGSETELGVNTTHVQIQNNFNETWYITANASQTNAVSISSTPLAPAYMATADSPREGTANTYALIHKGENIRLYRNNLLLNANTATDFLDGDGIRVVVNALDSETDQDHHLVFQRKRGGVYQDIPIDGGVIMPDYNVDSHLKPIVKVDGRMECGGVGTGQVGQTEAQTAFKTADYAISLISGNFTAGEIMYHTASSGTGTGLRVLAVCGTNLLGTDGLLTGVLVMANGEEGTGYANGDTINMKGINSGSTCVLTIGAVPSAVFNIANAGTGYVAGQRYPFTINAPVANPPYPFTQSGRVAGIGKPIDGELVVRTIGLGGLITEFTILDVGSGFCAGDTIAITGGNNDARISFSLVSEDATQMVFGNDISTKIVDWEDPIRPQSEGMIDTTQGGNSTLGDDLLLRPLVFTGDLRENNGVGQVNSLRNPPHTNPANENILIDIPNFPIGSRNSQGNTDNHIATIPYTADLDIINDSQKQHYEPFNMTYHRLDNEDNLNLNHIEVRLTDHEGKVRTDLKHPTQLTFMLDPDYK